MLVLWMMLSQSLPDVKVEKRLNDPTLLWFCLLSSASTICEGGILSAGLGLPAGSQQPELKASCGDPPGSPSRGDELSYDTGTYSTSLLGEGAQRAQ